ncbi:MAG: hypothetical protein KAV00_03590 [Phycisphaerae bacterium]|nr:hypothetical protein [Phycisphaerae bacterium]
MISRVHSSILQGIDAVAGEVEADVARGGLGMDTEGFAPSGFADATVQADSGTFSSYSRLMG